MLSGKSPKSDETHLKNGSATLKIIQKNILMPDCHRDYPAFFCHCLRFKIKPSDLNLVKQIYFVN